MEKTVEDCIFIISARIVIMKTFYSIIFVPIKQESKERLAVGLFMRNEKELFFAYSKFKLHIVRELLSKSAYDLVALNLRNIDRSVVQASEDSIAARNGFFGESMDSSSYLSDSYFNYLARYSNNLLGFTSPKQIAIQNTKENFHLLFSKLVDENHFSDIRLEDEFDIVKKTRSTLRPLIEERVNWDFEITRKHVPGLIFPSVHMDFAGKNELLVSGQAVDFEKKLNFLEYDISKHIVLLDAMKQLNENSKCFVLGKEPNKREHPKNHQIWKNVKDEQRINFVDADEYDRVVEYMEVHDVRPLVLDQTS